MNATNFTTLFLALLVLTTLVKLWLAQRQLKHVAANRAEVPTAFREQVSIAAHHKAADYTLALVQLGALSVLLEAVLIWAFTLGGGIQWLNDGLSSLLQSPILQGAAIIVAVLMLQSLLEMPFDLYRTFNIEARFGFNKMTLKLYLTDMLKGLLLGAALGLPLLFGVLWLMAKMGDLWWLYVWGVWVVFNLLLLFIYPTYIAPIFNKFEPLRDEAQKAHIEALLAKCGFSASGLFVMDGSKRSTHGNAYFTGFGKSKRIVFFDTLLQRLSPGENRCRAVARTGALQAAPCAEAHRIYLCTQPGFPLVAGAIAACRMVLSRPRCRHAKHRAGAVAVLHGDAGVYLFVASHHLGLFAQARVRGGCLCRTANRCQ